MEQDAYQAGQAEFNLPHDVIQLPSQGVFYKSKKKFVLVALSILPLKKLLAGTMMYFYSTT